MSQYDIIVIGGGPGGYVAAIRASQLGAKVCLIEKDKIGGTCLNRGCIPTKAIIASTNLYEKIKKAESFGVSCGTPAIDLNKVIERKNKIVEKITKGVEFLLKKNGVDVVYGEAKVLGPGKVEVKKSDFVPRGLSPRDSSKSLVVSRKIVLATGSSPISIPGIGFDGKKFVSSDDLLEATEIPPKLDIVGGGVIGLHFAQIYSALGSEITIYEALPEILPGVDEEIVAMVKRILKRRKVTVLTDTRFDQAKSCGKSLICVGRTPNTTGLEDLGLKMEKRSVWVNEKMETSIPGIYAVGDLVSPKMLAHIAYEQGVVAAENAMGKNKSFTYDFIPFGIYTHPEIGSVGLTENEARSKFGDKIKIGKFPFAALGIAQAMSEIEGFIKVISDEHNKILGVHILGPEATTLIGTATIAAKQGLKVDQLAESFQAHPSYPEGLQEAALNTLKRGLYSLN
ncbi:MAG: dihydrolipoyl dehydrogenase [Candidatus Saganbacteria bacterium]|nr:dihydrolipoyl dehydrogenase [Candidatus Saganbacteria bacterium]